MPITGVHALFYTSEPEAVRGIFRDVFGWEHVDDGRGWLIFALPPAELGVHPTDEKAAEAGGHPPHHELTFMCDDLDATLQDLQSKGVEVRGEPAATAWGLTATLVLPGDLEIMVYQPRHRTAI